MISPNSIFIATTVLISSATANNGYFGMKATASFSTTLIDSMSIFVLDGVPGALPVCNGTVSKLKFPASGSLLCLGEQTLSWRWNAAKKPPVATYRATPYIEPSDYVLRKPEGSKAWAPTGEKDFVTAELEFGTVLELNGNYEKPINNTSYPDTDGFNIFVTTSQRLDGVVIDIHVTESPGRDECYLYRRVTGYPMQGQISCTGTWQDRRMEYLWHGVDEGGIAKQMVVKLYSPQAPDGNVYSPEVTSPCRDGANCAWMLNSKWK